MVNEYSKKYIRFFFPTKIRNKYHISNRIKTDNNKVYIIDDIIGSLKFKRNELKIIK